MSFDPSTPAPITRRDAVKIIGGGAAVLGLAGMATLSASAAPTPLVVPRSTSGDLKQPFTLPPLGYGYDALEPHIDARTMEIHYTKHHQAYITNANKALDGHPALLSLTAEDILRNLPAIPDSMRGVLRNNVGGHVNHSFFWKVIGPNRGGLPSGALAQAIDQGFGSFEACKAQFNEAAMKRFGSGWAWLSLKGGRLQIHSTANQDSPLTEGAIPVLGLDVWEHAYYLKHQNVRADYVTAFWSVVNWEQAGANFAAAKAA
jgi:Fe-Mn family superoxide dismutase